LLDGVQSQLFEDARKFRDDNTFEIESYEQFKEGLEEKAGFWTGAWCGDVACEDKVKEETKATIRLLPIEQSDPGAPCSVCGRAGTERATWARAY
jgi:prolyl-tRNA synthetase